MSNVQSCKRGVSFKWAKYVDLIWGEGYAKNTSYEGSYPPPPPPPHTDESIYTLQFKRQKTYNQKQPKVKFDECQSFEQ